MIDCGQTQSCAGPVQVATVALGVMTSLTIPCSEDSISQLSSLLSSSYVLSASLFHSDSWTLGVKGGTNGLLRTGHSAKTYPCHLKQSCVSAFRACKEKPRLRPEVASVNGDNHKPLEGRPLLHLYHSLNGYIEVFHANINQTLKSAPPIKFTNETRRES